MASIKRNEWIFDNINTSIGLKDRWKRFNILNMLSKTVRMFNYKNLPDSISQKDLEIQLQCNGFCIWKMVDDKLYVFYGGLGGEPNPYYLPTKAIIANPSLNYNATLEIDTECVVMLNDYFYMGLMPLFDKYSTLLTEAEITLKNSIINARIPAIATADNDNARESAEEFFKDIVDGDEYGIVVDQSMYEGFKTHDFSKRAVIKEAIEAVQYIKGSAFNEIGLNATFNMKREAINTAEATMNEDILFPFIEGMLEMRRIGLKKVNEMFGTNISVEFDSTWLRNLDTSKLEIELLENEVENEEESS